MTATSSKREQRPVLDLPRSSFEIVGELLALIGIIVTVAILLYAWPDLPDRVPTHFGVTGEPDSWGSKTSVLFPPLVMMALYAGLTILNRFPHIFNYPRVITEENAPRQYRLARTLMTWLKAELVWLFAFLEWSIVRTAQGESTGIGVVFLPVMLIVLFGTLGIYFWVSARKA
ncbi:DUF1648 domain-containing protein [Sphaerobacter thermophilus]|mgnify:CR=1 FL=1|jgi:Predicted membrane protein|uniref:DUF1648 domain-containing protein n=1 Tax=Sphaerobacter thermophilus (strain ATCC 49802 / DSM 20745 / KCCM 41009 / NCIMB 13125 / S 6022) TaxID=479434 RepID=D1C6C3_SPHTD|nr:DUF1648 domain-containing protein [Sphaerobacter thermophilus]ACZ37661.1 protein of unknown function DUF1648 [Sphaerobacter thermophilus DSM 20745]